MGAVSGIHMTLPNPTSHMQLHKGKSDDREPPKTFTFDQVSMSDIAGPLNDSILPVLHANTTSSCAGHLEAHKV